MIDLAGAIVMGAYAKHKIKKDYQRCGGTESLVVATTVLGMDDMRRGSKRLITLGGLYGITGALCDIARNEAARRRVPVYDDEIVFLPHKTSDNRHLAFELRGWFFLWSIPMDYETRDSYNQALSITKDG